MSKVTALYHIVFCTKKREKTIPLPHSEDLYRFIWKEIEETDSKLIRINGIENHIHILVDTNPSVALSDLVKAIKSHSSRWMKADPRFKSFIGWAPEYYACSISPDDKNAVIEYIKNQRTHHLATVLDNELQEIYRHAGLQYDDRDMV